MQQPRCQLIFHTCLIHVFTTTKITHRPQRLLVNDSFVSTPYKLRSIYFELTYFLIVRSVSK